MLVARDSYRQAIGSIAIRGEKSLCRRRLALAPSRHEFVIGIDSGWHVINLHLFTTAPGLRRSSPGSSQSTLRRRTGAVAGRGGGAKRCVSRQTITVASDSPACGEHRTLDVREDLPCMFEKQSASARQPHPPLGAFEQLNVDLFLELFDLLTERRLRDVEALRGPPEIQLFSDGNEVSQMT
jgi:hypothetical protein